jgi:agmatinase
MKNKMIPFIAKQSPLELSNIVLLQAPYEHTVSYLKGTSNGPKAILEASPNLEFFDHELGIDTEELNIHTSEEFDRDLDLENAIKTIYIKSKELLAKDKFLILLGGEHSVSYPIIKAHSEKYDNLSVLQIDAHADLRDSYEGSLYNHACVMRRVLDLGLKTCQIGIRNMSREEYDLIRNRNLTVYNASLFENNSRTEEEALVKDIVSNLTDNVYITIDVDGLDPSIMPATGTPEPNGLKWHQVMNIFKETYRSRRVVGADIVELSPRANLEFSDFIAAKLLLKLINYKVAYQS